MNLLLLQSPSLIVLIQHTTNFGGFHEIKFTFNHSKKEVKVKGYKANKSLPCKARLCWLRSSWKVSLVLWPRKHHCLLNNWVHVLNKTRLAQDVQSWHPACEDFFFFHFWGFLPSVLGPQSLVLNPRSSAISPQSSINSPQTSFLNPRSSILGPQSSALNPRSSIPGPQSSVLNSQSSILGPQSSVLNPRSSILNLQSSVLNPLSSILSSQSSIFCPQSSILGPHFSIYGIFEPMSQKSQHMRFEDKTLDQVSLCQPDHNTGLLGEALDINLLTGRNPLKL